MVTAALVIRQGLILVSAATVRSHKSADHREHLPLFPGTASQDGCRGVCRHTVMTAEPQADLQAVTAT